MAKVIDVSNCPRVPLQKALDSGERACAVTLAFGGEIVRPLPMLWPCAATPEIATSHDPALTTPDVEVYFLRSAALRGPGAQPCLDDAYVAAMGAIPFYISNFISRDLQSHLWNPAPVTRPRHVASAFSVLHYNLPYGHWLTEMFPKLFVIRRLAEAGVTAPIALPSTTPRWVSAIIRDTLPDQSIITYDPRREHLQADLLLLPGMMHEAYAFNDLLGVEIARHVTERLEPISGLSLADAARRHLRPPPAPNKRLFVSRRRVPSIFRTLANADELEAIAVELGFTVIEPQQHIWRDQVASFAHARVIVGEYGSGTHNSMFAKEGGVVVCLNWVVEVQSRLCNFRKQRVGYLLADDNRPRLYSLDGGHHAYRIDPDTFRDRVETALKATNA